MSWLQKFAQGQVLLMDGAMGTELLRAGLRPASAAKPGA